MLRGRSKNPWLARSLAFFLVVGCGEKDAPKQSYERPFAPTHAEHAGRRDSRPPPLARPVDLWRGGRVEKKVDAARAADEGYILLDLGESWTPYIFSERGNESEPVVPNTYRKTYIALAKGEFPDDLHGDRARRDKYLELYGIEPTLGLIRKRIEQIESKSCVPELDLSAIQAFDGMISYATRHRGRPIGEAFRLAERAVQRSMARQHVDAPDKIDASTLQLSERRALDDYVALQPKVAAMHAVQARLKCEGFFEGRERFAEGAMDWQTHEALVEFERRNRIYGWGYIGLDTIEALRRTPIENEREAALRVLTERAVHAAGVIEDGSTSENADGTPKTFRGGDGKDHPIPNLEADLRARVIEAFGLASAESTVAWLRGLGELGEERVVAIAAPTLPEYYDGNMELFVQVDRGDVWYDFPFDAQGRAIEQPVSRRPRTTIFTEYLGQRIPLARFGTTIGGWRTEYMGGRVWLKYKESPVGPRYWHQIVASPVWLPPDTTPPEDLLKKIPPSRRRRLGPDAKMYEVNAHETGPSYASAYGLVAAYHMKGLRRADGTYSFFGDEGIRSHGSVDYMSIMRRHSHGCHRLHNHIAVRLMSFVLAHRPHKRVGQQRLAFRRLLEHEGHEYMLAIDEGGYVFDLEEPVPVNVLEGTIRGSTRQAITTPVPQFNETYGVYLMPDNTAVRVAPDGTLMPTALPTVLPDGGVPPPLPPPVVTVDGGLPLGSTLDGGVLPPPPALGAPDPGGDPRGDLPISPGVRTVP